MDPGRRKKVIILVAAAVLLGVVIFLSARPIGRRETIHLIAKMISETDFTSRDDMNRLLEDIKALRLVEDARFEDTGHDSAYVRVKFKGELGSHRIGYDGLR